MTDLQFAFLVFCASSLLMTTIRIADLLRDIRAELRRGRP